MDEVESRGLAPRDRFQLNRSSNIRLDNPK
jgi:hypothetical protein